MNSSKDFNEVGAQVLEELKVGSLFSVRISSFVEEYHQCGFGR